MMLNWSFWRLQAVLGETFTHPFYPISFWHTLSYFSVIDGFSHTFSAIGTFSHPFSAFNTLSHTFQALGTIAHILVLLCFLRFFYTQLWCCAHILLWCSQEIGLILVWLSHYSLLKYFSVRRLRVSEVHQFVQQFVDDAEVVTDALLFNILEIVLKNLKSRVSDILLTKVLLNSLI